MNRLSEIELMRLLHGELPPERARELRERLVREPELAERLRRLDATWGRLELPPTAPPPRGFARGVVARAEQGGLWSVAPTRIRAAAAGMLAVGLTLGIALASSLTDRSVAPRLSTSPGTARRPATEQLAEFGGDLLGLDDSFAAEETIADDFWQAFGATEPVAGSEGL